MEEDYHGEGKVWVMQLIILAIHYIAQATKLA